MELRPDLWHCADCGTAYAVGLTCCPHCSSERRADLVPPSAETPPPARSADDEPEEM